MGSRVANLYLEKVLWRPVNLIEALLARVRHSLHDGPMQRRGTMRRRRRRLRRSGLVVGSPTGVLLFRQFGGLDDNAGLSVYELALPAGCFRSWSEGGG